MVLQDIEAVGERFKLDYQDQCKGLIYTQLRNHNTYA
jgi:hypothetical protein